MIIIDEANRFIRMTGASFREDNGVLMLQGIHCFGNIPVLICSATFGRLELRIVQRVLGIKEKNCLSFDSAKEYYLGKKITPRILALPMIKNSVKSTLHDYFLKHRTQPVIVFMVKDDEKLVKIIKKMAAKLPGKFYSVTSESGLSYAID